jgi:hypothetical protein
MEQLFWRGFQVDKNIIENMPDIELELFLNVLTVIK